MVRCGALATKARNSMVVETSFADALVRECTNRVWRNSLRAHRCCWVVAWLYLDLGISRTVEAHRASVRPRRSSLVSRYARFWGSYPGYARFWSFYSSAGCAWVAELSPFSASVSSGSWNSERSKVEEKTLGRLDNLSKCWMFLRVGSCTIENQWPCFCHHDSFFHTHQKPPHLGHF